MLALPKNFSAVTHVLNTSLELLEENLGAGAAAGRGSTASGTEAARLLSGSTVGLLSGLLAVLALLLAGLSVLAGLLARGTVRLLTRLAVLTRLLAGLSVLALLLARLAVLSLLAGLARLSVLSLLTRLAVLALLALLTRLLAVSGRSAVLTLRLAGSAVRLLTGLLAVLATLLSGPVVVHQRFVLSEAIGEALGGWESGCRKVSDAWEWIEGQWRVVTVQDRSTMQMRKEGQCGAHNDPFLAAPQIVKERQTDVASIIGRHCADLTLPSIRVHAVRQTYL